MLLEEEMEKECDCWPENSVKEEVNEGGWRWVTGRSGGEKEEATRHMVPKRGSWWKWDPHAKLHLFRLK